MKRVLIISPDFPPVNAADMHRMRQSLPYFKDFGWDAEVIAVETKYVNAYSIDNLLTETIPAYVKVHHVKAWDISKTRKFGLGALGIRSFFFICKKGNELLRSGKFDLIYFSTTAFHVMALGPYWKRKFDVPFVLDIQDPWRNDFYLSKPKDERPPKFWLAYNIDKYLERKTIPHAAGIISVSEGYNKTFLLRYPSVTPDKLAVIPFGGSSIDFEVMQKNIESSAKINFNNNKINILYAGRGGHDMRFASEVLFAAINLGLQVENDIFSKIKLWFVGTSYAVEGSGKKTFEPIAEKLNLQDRVTEVTDRIPYFETLFLLKNAALLFMPGSSDKNYTASKIYPYILSKKPLLAVFHRNSSVVDIINDTKSGEVIKFNDNDDPKQYAEDCMGMIKKLIIKKESTFDLQAFEPYTAKSMTRKQVYCFEKWT
ncbi:hypothetical protein BH09BAC2_BH09BAC2_15770 [soil metagenome]